ncbi:MutS protein msh4 [Puccinia graminis f. sp. tritici]|uniref:MutS protein msh4 n=1 Tax=Puccinia graminis f. sp. tritici TaxID=56615 RepID=A0A5B0RH60_PUCGR|nr:MutS protein msh4 [Puccinia graminis f. sp. tritici]
MEAMVRTSSGIRKHAIILIACLFQGIELASIAALPPDVMSRAKQISEEMSGLSTEVEKNSTTNKVLRRRKVLLEVCTNLKNLANHSKLPSPELGKFLKDYQRDTIHCLQPDEDMLSLES